MEVAICGSLQFASQNQIQRKLKNSGIEFKFFIKDFTNDSARIDLFDNLQPITFFEFKRLVDAGKLDGLIFANSRGALINSNLITFFKFHEIPNVGLFTGQSLPSPIYWLEMDKTFITYLETNLIDSCNLNCKGCTHFSVLFNRKEIYPLETFRRDIRILSSKSDILRFRLLGGEPLLLNNLDKYKNFS
ncbi:MAG: 4Fe-4S cluster-binding domain-containing protein [Selenomonadaceae bacterium]|nr:4Fe-4S cluster-binding domain-containing protein [Selenomonadaceae bacterium]